MSRRFSLVFFVICFGTMFAPAQTVTTTPGSLLELDVVGPDSVAFNSAVTQVFGVPSLGALGPHIQSILPFSIVIGNRSRQTIVCVAASWVLTDVTGRVTPRTVTRNFQGAQRLTPGKSIVFSSYGTLDPKSAEEKVAGQPGLAALLNLFQSQQRVVITLDGVVFDSGKFIGPNTQNEFEQLRAEFSVPRAVALELLARRDQGVAQADIEQWLNTKTATRSAPGAGPSEEWQAFFQRRTARLLLRMEKGRGYETMLRLAGTIASQGMDISR